MEKPGLTRDLSAFSRLYANYTDCVADDTVNLTVGKMQPGNRGPHYNQGVAIIIRWMELCIEL
jgi:hypothetical protein